MIAVRAPESFSKCTIGSVSRPNYALVYAAHQE